jgi:hypothetical protein
MEILSVKTVEDCFDGRFIRDIVVATPLSREQMEELAKDGRLQIFDKVTPAFFKVDVPGVYSAKLVENKETIRVTFYDDEGFRSTLERLRNLA